MTKFCSAFLDMICVPVAYDIYYNKSNDEKSIIIVVSPLMALIRDQVNNLSKRGISVGFIDSESSSSTKEAGAYSIVYEPRNVGRKVEEFVNEPSLSETVGWNYS